MFLNGMAREPTLMSEFTCVPPLPSELCPCLHMSPGSVPAGGKNLDQNRDSGCPLTWLCRLHHSPIRPTLESQGRCSGSKGMVIVLLKAQTQSGNGGQSLAGIQRLFPPLWRQTETVLGPATCRGMFGPRGWIEQANLSFTTQVSPDPDTTGSAHDPLESQCLGWC